MDTNMIWLCILLREIGSGYFNEEELIKETYKTASIVVERLQAENDRLKETISCYCDMCIEQDGVLWCQSCDEKCDYCIHPKESQQ